MNRQASGLIQLQSVSAVEAKLDFFGVGSRLDDKVELQLSLRTVVNEIYARIDFSINDFRVSWNSNSPLLWVLANKIVGLTRKRFQRLHFRLEIAAEQIHSQHSRARIWNGAFGQMIPRCLRSASARRSGQRRSQ